MPSDPTGAKALIAALSARSDVEAVTLFGSRARASDDSGSDAGSDYDVQVVASQPERLLRRDWAESVVGEGAIVGWCRRDALGAVVKVSILLPNEELDIVVVPARRMRLARWALRWGLHRRSRRIAQQLEPLVLVMGRGYRVLKGGARWESFWLSLFRDIPEPRLSDEAVRNLGERAHVDLVSIKRKLDRGELRAAQRWLHTGLAETNFALMHEWRRRRDESSFFDGRRVEVLLSEAELAAVTVTSSLDPTEISQAAERAAQTADRLVEAVLNRSAGLPD